MFGGEHIKISYERRRNLGEGLEEGSLYTMEAEETNLGEWGSIISVDSEEILLGEEGGVASLGGEVGGEKIGGIR